MSNSSLVSYTKLSPNNSGRRTHSIDRITPHCVVGQLSVETLGGLFARSSYQASCNYAIGSDGRIALIVDEGQRSWCSSSNANDQRAVTIECASDKTSPYAFNTTVYNRLVDLCVDICRRNGKNKLIWISDKNTALNYSPKSGEMLLTVHRWFANKSCPGDWLMARMGSLASTVTARLGGAAVPVTAEARSLSKGDSGEDVKKMQQLLIACGYDCGSWGADGDFGSATESALEKMQKENGLSVDGVYGPKSKAALEALYKKKEEEKKKREEQERAAQAAQPVTTNGKEIKIFYPGYTRTDSPDDRQGAGCVWHDQDGHCIVIDAYEKGSAAAKRLVQYLVDNKLYTIDFVGTHAHPDHLGGGFRILEDGRFKVQNVYVYDPNSLKLAGDGTKNGRSAAEDKAYLIKFINAAKNKGAKVHYVETGDTIKCGEIEFNVYRNQPAHWSEYDTGEAWAYLNDGSICLYSRQSYYMMSGDADGSQFVEKYDLTVKGCEVGHHGNNGNRTSARIYVAHGCIFAIQCNNEQGQPGSCEFTRYGSGRMREAGVPVWQLTGDIRGVIKAGKITWTQGGNSISWAVPYGAQLYRVRKTWADSKSQKGAYNILANAKAEADKWGGEYAVFDWNGKEIYRPGKKTEDKAEPTKEQTPQEAFIAKVGPMVKADMQKNGVCAAVSLAQAILESSYGKSELATGGANNLFGMKKNLSGNTWPGSVWDGRVYSKQTKEVYASGPATVQADFRAYKDWQASVNDHSAYLAGAKNGSALRYKGIVGADTMTTIDIIVRGGYATAPDYKDKLRRLIEQYDLTKWNTTYNKEEAPKTDTKPAEQKPAGDGLFRVRRTWTDSKSQVGAYKIYENARLKADETGLTVYDSTGKAVYTGKQAAAVPFLVRVKTGMNIRKTPGGTIYRDCPVGVYTIVETSGDWGRLKAGGWIYIAQPRWVERI